ncbi:MAG TPA: hypothetical protein RMG48_05015 [Myxococcales bacterium LLY-WYZ-16_1]|nr:hypothetical protein [Myxococcales bacterium LLY-WYZ-16_1]
MKRFILGVICLGAYSCNVNPLGTREFEVEVVESLKLLGFRDIGIYNAGTDRIARLTDDGDSKVRVFRDGTNLTLDASNNPLARVVIDVPDATRIEVERSSGSIYLSEDPGPIELVVKESRIELDVSVDSCRLLVTDSVVEEDRFDSQSGRDWNIEAASSSVSLTLRGIEAVKVILTNGAYAEFFGAFGMKPFFEVDAVDSSLSASRVGALGMRATLLRSDAEVCVQDGPLQVSAREGSVLRLYEGCEATTVDIDLDASSTSTTFHHR